MQTDRTLMRNALAITEKKKCWGLLAQKFGLFQTLRKQLPTTGNDMRNGVRRTQHMTPNNSHYINFTFS